MSVESIALMQRGGDADGELFGRLIVHLPPDGTPGVFHLAGAPSREPEIREFLMERGVSTAAIEEMLNGARESYASSFTGAHGVPLRP